MILPRFSTLNSPPLVASVGSIVMLGLPAVEAFAASSASLAFLKGANFLGFATNVASVSVPGRKDGREDEEMRKGALNAVKGTDGANAVGGEIRREEEQHLVAGDSASFYTTKRKRTLVVPSGWAFSIWGPIYLGEAGFVGAQIFTSVGALSDLNVILPQVTVPFVAANIFQSLWCASFRPRYENSWRKYVSVGMLAGTAYSLSCVHAIGCSPEAASIRWLFLPMSLHFGWTTAATLVNLNSSVAMEKNVSNSAVIALGHASAVTAAALGVGITLAQSDPVYGLAVGWALAACADGMRKRMSLSEGMDSGSLKTGAGVQKLLCIAGSSSCIAASLLSAFA